MAVLDNIRKRTGLMLIVVLGATSAFILGDLINTGGGSSQTSIGEINGEEVDQQVYNSLVSKYDQPGRGSRSVAESQAWNEMIFEYGWRPQLEEAGIDVSRDFDDDETSEEYDMLQGKTLHKAFFSENRDNLPHDEFVEQFNGIITNIMQAGDAHPSYNQLMSQKELLYTSRLRDKYTSLYTNSVYVTTAEARRKNQSEGADAGKVSFEYVYAPYNSIQDSNVTVTDAELETYISSHENEFEVKDGRDIKYVALSYKASKIDKLDLRKKGILLRREFKTAKSDQEFVNLNSDVQSTVELDVYDNLPARIKSDSANLEEGKIYGPLFSVDKFDIHKVSEIRLGEGISKTSISVISVDTSNVDADKLAAALDSASTILETALIDSASAASLSWQSLGEIETTDTLKYSPEMLEAAFAETETGVYSSLVSYPKGVLILKRDTEVEQADDKYAVATVELELTPSQITRDSVWEIASRLIEEAEDLTSFEDSVNNRPELRLESAKNVDKNARNIGRYNGDDIQSIISWAYQNPVNTISGNIYELPDDETYLVVAIAGETNEGDVTVESVREEVTKKVIKEKKGKELTELMSKYKGKSLAEISIEINKEKTPTFSSYNSVNNLTLGARRIPNFNFGNEPIMAGAAFGLEKDATSAVLVGDNGVFIVKVTDKTEAVAKKDYKDEKESMASSNKYAQSGKLNTAFTELIEVEDNRYLRR